MSASTFGIGWGVMTCNEMGLIEMTEIRRDYMKRRHARMTACPLEMEPNGMQCTNIA